MSDNNWYVVTGGPSVGKTTLLDELAELGNMTLPEAARVVIDEGIETGRTVEEIRQDELAFQMEVLERKQITENNQQPGQLIFFDRGMHDTLAYFRLHGFEITDPVKTAMETAGYRRVFLLEPVGEFQKDYARTESASEALKLNELLRQVYEEYGMEVISVPALPPAERAGFILQHLG